MKDQYVHYGSGWCAPLNWHNFDISPTLRFERLPLIGKLYTRNENRFPDNVRYGDITKGLPITKGSCSGVYCSHVLEHLSLEDFRIALKNSFDMLKSDGYFRFVLPDLHFLASTYVENPESEASMIFMKKAHLGVEKRQKGFSGVISAALGNSLHLWMWDYKSMAVELEKVGFVNIRRASFGDAEDSIFNEVEEIQRWKNCLGVQCQKP